ncbi:hypothetical protein Acr_00g0090220 [Actinidia rufa]|uniref:Uncharacterized protein n=1 Tax=Actinidia rufa TaxID=165716 RepID=A0A7J0DZB1_9ERIC|nr:hypothetical protein Acr_00g0090220 [Actinidia rufa]
MEVYPGDVGELIGEIAIWRVSRDLRCCGGENIAMCSFHVQIGFEGRLIKSSTISRPKVRRRPLRHRFTEEYPDNVTLEGSEISLDALMRRWDFIGWVSGDVLGSGSESESGQFYFKARLGKNILKGPPNNVKGWKRRFFFISGDDWEFHLTIPREEGAVRVLRSWGPLGASLIPHRGGEILPGLREDRKRALQNSNDLELENLLQIFRPPLSRGIFKQQRSSVEFIGTIREEMRRIFLHVFDLDLLRRSREKDRDPFLGPTPSSLSLSSSSRLGSQLDSGLSPELRSDGALSEEKAKGKKATEEVETRNDVVVKLEAQVAELEKSQNLSMGRIIAAFKESDDFMEAMMGSASSYFGDDFDFCKRQLAHHYPNLGVDLEDIWRRKRIK